MTASTARIGRESEFWDLKAGAAATLDPELYIVRAEDRHDRSVPWLPIMGFPSLIECVLGRIGDPRGKRILDIGSGTGFLATLLARNGATVDSIDVSEASLDVARQRAALSGVAETTNFHCMPAEALDFPDETFDAVTGVFVLHHLDLAVAGPEIRRVLKPGGRAAFIETSAGSSLLMAARNFLPGRFGIEKASSDDEAPLGPKARGILEATFGPEVRYHHPEFVFFRMAGYLPGMSRPPILWPMRKLDALLGRFPAIARKSYHIVVSFGRPASG